MKYQWADGARPPKDVTADALMERLMTLPSPSPEASFEASKAPGDLLHDATWGEGDQVWANRARLEFHRHLIGAVQETIVVGGRSISIRAVEFVKVGGESQWTTLDDIRSSPELTDAYMAEILRLQDQAAAKMGKLRELMRPE